MSDVIRDVHTEHCCAQHGCKYSDSDCPVASGNKPQSYPCESCEWGKEDTARHNAAQAAEIDALRTRLEDTVRDSTNKIEALRVELREAWSAVDSKAGWEWKKRAEQAEARAERLAEALEFQSALKKNLLPYQDEAVASRAEIEALKTEVAAQRTRADAMTGEAIKHEARAKRLAEALRVLADAFESRMADEENPDWNECWNNAHALLRELEQGK